MFNKRKERIEELENKLNSLERKVDVLKYKDNTPADYSKYAVEKLNIKRREELGNEFLEVLSELVKNRIESLGTTSTKSIVFYSKLPSNRCGGIEPEAFNYVVANQEGLRKLGYEVTFEKKYDIPVAVVK